MEKCPKCDSPVFVTSGNVYCQGSEELVVNCTRTIEETLKWRDWNHAWRINNYG